MTGAARRWRVVAHPSNLQIDDGGGLPMRPSKSHLTRIAQLANLLDLEEADLRVDVHGEWSRHVDGAVTAFIRDMSSTATRDHLDDPIMEGVETLFADVPGTCAFAAHGLNFLAILRLKRYKFMLTVITPASPGKPSPLNPSIFVNHIGTPRRPQDIHILIPLAPGVMYVAYGGITDAEAFVRIDPHIAPIPQTLLSSLPGRPLSEAISSPHLDRFNLIVQEIGTIPGANGIDRERLSLTTPNATIREIMAMAAKPPA